MYLRSLLLLLFSFSLAACLSPPSLPGEFCTDPRPQVCTMDYAPVCGIDADGMRADFSNACSACSVADIVSWTEGLCTEEE